MSTGQCGSLGNTAIARPSVSLFVMTMPLRLIKVPKIGPRRA